MRKYYAEYFLQTEAGEQYILPVFVESEAPDDSKRSVEDLKAALSAIVKEVRLQFGPEELNGWFGERFPARISHWYGHVRAGRIHIDQFVYTKIGDGSLDGLEILPGEDALPIARLNCSDHQLYRILGSNKSTSGGEVFVLQLDANVDAGKFLPVPAAPRKCI